MKIENISSIQYVLNNYPETYEVFLSNGFRSNSREELIDTLGENTLLKTVLKIKGINEKIFIDMLNEKISKTCSMDEMDEINHIFHNPELPLNLLIKTACPVGAKFREDISSVIRKHEEQTGKSTNCFLVGGCDAPHKYDNFWEQENIDELPDIVMSMSFDEIYDKRFIDKFIKTGNFQNVLHNVNDKYKNMGIVDDSYTLSAALPIVFLIDENRLGDLPRPKTWSDLLKPIYKDEIVCFGRGTGEVFEYLLYYLYKEFGMDGIRKFADNVKFACHGAKMAKIAGSNSPQTGAIHTIPLNFSEFRDRKNTSLIIPEDGGCIIPISFIVKKDKVEELKYLTDFLLNEYGQMCADIGGISFNSNVKNKISKDVKIKWLGWNYVKSTDLLRLAEELKEEFYEIWDKKPKHNK